MILHLYILGAFKYVPTALVGSIPVLPTIAFALRALALAVLDIRTGLEHETETAAHAARIHRLKTIQKKGDFLVRVGGGKQFPMDAPNFMASYTLAEHDGITQEPNQSGFQPYQPNMRVWAREILAGDLPAHFPKGRFISSSGSSVTVRAGDYLTTPFPSGGELSCVPKQQFDRKYRFEADAQQQSMVKFASAVSSQPMALALWNTRLRSHGRIYVKTTEVYARVAMHDGVVPTSSTTSENEAPYKKGDYIVYNSKNKRARQVVLLASDFGAKFEGVSRPNLLVEALQSETVVKARRLSQQLLAAPAAATDGSTEALRAEEEGFKRYKSKDKVYAKELVTEEVAKYFPSGHFLGRDGDLIEATAGSWIVMPSDGSELFTIEKRTFSRKYKLHIPNDHVPLHDEALADWEDKLMSEGGLCRQHGTLLAKLVEDDSAVGSEEALALSELQHLKTVTKILDNDGNGDNSDDDDEEAVPALAVALPYRF